MPVGILVWTIGLFLAVGLLFTTEGTEESYWKDDYKEPNVAFLQPAWDGSGFVWPDLEVKSSSGKGRGVFAKRDIPKGSEIPILGKIDG